MTLLENPRASCHREGLFSEVLDSWSQADWGINRLWKAQFKAGNCRSCVWVQWVSEPTIPCKLPCQGTAVPAGLQLLCFSLHTGAWNFYIPAWLAMQYAAVLVGQLDIKLSSLCKHKHGAREEICSKRWPAPREVGGISGLLGSGFGS